MKYNFTHNSDGQRIALDVCKARCYGALLPCRRCSYFKKKRFCPKLRAEKLAQKRRRSMTISKLIEKLLPFRGNTEIEFTFYCHETNKTYRINPDKILTIYDAKEDKVEFYTTNAPGKIR